MKFESNNALFLRINGQDTIEMHTNEGQFLEYLCPVYVLRNVIYLPWNSRLHNVTSNSC